MKRRESSSPKEFLILDKLSSILHQGQLAFQTASAPFASEPLAIPTATAPVRRSAARVSNLNPFASRPARVQLVFSSRPARVPAQLEIWSRHRKFGRLDLVKARKREKTSQDVQVPPNQMDARGKDKNACETVRMNVDLLGENKLQYVEIGRLVVVPAEAPIGTHAGRLGQCVLYGQMNECAPICFKTLIRTRRYRRTLIRSRLRSRSCPPDQLQPQCVPDPRQTQLHPASKTSSVPDCKRPVRIRAARDPDCNNSRSMISCSRLQPQSVRVQASSCSARVLAQLEFGKHGASVAIMGRRKQVLDAAVSDLRSLGIQVGFRIVVFRPFVGEVIAASYPPVPTERGDDAKPFAPMVVTETLDDDGLGPVSWWEGSTSNENHEDYNDT
ncbi:hypothetical protein F2Q68_00008216 [Brassica cretica]|uniref:Uncharacterized protein n=1 Tax=Brassica cretica TaxID=69181 RepID=A0A8S9KNE2_BRACR|nr:hypothetical protein F2Q68_00008216 [Brassica cretica]